jgi:hypothetical protein
MRTTLRITGSLLGTLVAFVPTFFGVLRLQLAYYGRASYEHDGGAGFAAVMLSQFVSSGVAIAVFCLILKVLKRQYPPT